MMFFLYLRIKMKKSKYMNTSLKKEHITQSHHEHLTYHEHFTYHE